MTSLTKDFASQDYNGDGHLETSELMFHQYATGCEPIEAQVRAQDYMRCGDTNKDTFIDLKESNIRRSHGFVKFFDADQNMDNFLTKPELVVGLIKLWGQPGETLAQPLLDCADKDKDSKLSQDEFHASIAAYNPVTRKWEMWSGTSDKGILTCMESAFKTFDAALVFHATDTNKDRRISEQEAYDTMRAVNGPKIQQTTVDAIF